MADYRQRQRHGAAKHLAEGLGGLVVGSALVLLLRDLLRPRNAPRAPGPSGTRPTASLPAQDARG